MDLDNLVKEDIDEIYQRMQSTAKKLEKYDSYAFGCNWDILHQEDESKPDNKIPVPIGKSIVTDIVGYAGRPGEIVTEYKYYPDEGSKGETDAVTELLDSFNEHNKEGLRNTQHLKTSLSDGLSWELWYTSEEMPLSKGMMTPEFMIINPKECYPIWSDDIKPVLEAFVRGWDNKDYYFIDIYRPKRSERWEKAKKPKDGEKSQWTRNEDGDTNYPYDRVPAIPFRSDMMNEPIFKAQIPLMDSYDQTYSKMKNEVDRFNAAILLLAGVLQSETKQDMREGKKIILEDLNSWEKWPEYLTKNLTGVDSFHNKFLDRTMDLIRETSKIVNFQELEAVVSGIAMRLKLVGMEFVVAEIEAYFREGLASRFDFYKDIFATSTWEKVDWDKYGQEITWKRNLPVDDKEKVEIAAMMLGLGLPLETAIKFLPNSIIENMSDKEIEEILGTVEGDEPESLVNVTPGNAEAAVKQATLSGIQIESANAIIQNVASGALSREAGVSQLVIFLGLTDEQAQKVMGKLSKTKTPQVPAVEKEK